MVRPAVMFPTGISFTIDFSGIISKQRCCLFDEILSLAVLKVVILTIFSAAQSVLPTLKPIGQNDLRNSGLTCH